MTNILCGWEHSESQSSKEVPGRNPANDGPQLPASLGLEVARHISQLWYVVKSVNARGKGLIIITTTVSLHSTTPTFNFRQYDNNASNMDYDLSKIHMR